MVKLKGVQYPLTRSLNVRFPEGIPIVLRLYLFTAVFKDLSLLDKLLTPLILSAMVIGVIIGEFVPGVQAAFNTVTFHDVSVRECFFFRFSLHPVHLGGLTRHLFFFYLDYIKVTQSFLTHLSTAIAIGLIIMMWPVLTKVQYEALPQLFRSYNLWLQIFISLLLNWLVGPLVMTALAWATLPDLPTYRVGVIVVGLGR